VTIYHVTLRDRETHTVVGYYDGRGQRTGVAR